MVDLVKIRKKAKKKKDEEPSAAEAAAPAPAAPAGPAAEESESPRERPEAEAEPQMPQPAAESAAEPPAASSSKLDRFKAEAGRRREEEVAAEAEETDHRLERLTFLIAGESYAVDIEKIVEIVTPRALTRVPNADPAVVGIVSLRGTVVTLIDARRKLGHPAAGPAGPETRIIVADLGTDIVGFLVDQVLRVVKVADEDVEPHPVVHATELDEAVRGVFRAGDALTILLDLEKLLDHASATA